MPEFQAVQAAFAAHLRDPEGQPPPPDIEDRRMAIYRRLFINNVEGFLANAFPVLRQLYADADWQAMARDFYARHRCQRPQFYQVAEEFLEYLAEEREPQAVDPPFLLELAHYEWIELILAIDPEAAPQDVDADGDLMAGVPALTPWLRNLSYQYPVHQLGPDNQPDAPPEQPTFLLVFRKSDDQIGFLEINAITARLVELLHDNRAASGRELLLRLAQEAGLSAEQVLAFGEGLYRQLHELGVIAGVYLPRH